MTERASCAKTAGGARRLRWLDAAPKGAAEAVSVLYRYVNVPLFIGEGDLDYGCPCCHAVVCQGIAAGDLAGVVVSCACGAVNQVPARR
jgi:hypothetical protein